MRNRLTYANVTATLALVIAVAGGTAYAANTVFSADIVNNEVYSADVRNDTLASGGLTAADLRSGSVGTTEILNGGVRSPDVPNEALTGADIANQSGVDTCVAGVRIGQLCVRAENHHRVWEEALAHCANLDMRLPSLGEALELAQTHDIPDVDENEEFWTEETVYIGSTYASHAVYEDGEVIVGVQSATYETVCVTTPTN